MSGFYQNNDNVEGGLRDMIAELLRENAALREAIRRALVPLSRLRGRDQGTAAEQFAYEILSRAVPPTTES